MNEEGPSQSQIAVYQSEDRRTRILKLPPSQARWWSGQTWRRSLNNLRNSLVTSRSHMALTSWLQQSRAFNMAPNLLCVKDGL